MTISLDSRSRENLMSINQQEKQCCVLRGGLSCVCRLHASKLTLQYRSRVKPGCPRRGVPGISLNWGKHRSPSSSLYLLEHKILTIKILTIKMKVLRQMWKKPDLKTKHCACAFSKWTKRDCWKLYFKYIEIYVYIYVCLHLRNNPQSKLQFSLSSLLHQEIACPENLILKCSHQRW